MQRYLFFTVLLLLSFTNSHSQPNRIPSIETGMFVCRADKYLICIENEDVDSEAITYAIKAINYTSGEKNIIDKQTINKCIKTSDSTIVYIKDSSLIICDLRQMQKKMYYKADKDLSILGIEYNSHTSKMLLILTNYKTNDVFINLIDENKHIVFCQNIKVNNVEIEGIITSLDTLDKFFVFSVQDKLHIVDSENNKLKLASSKCDSYAIGNGKVVYYKFVTDEKTEGYSIDPITFENKKIGNSLNEKIYNCAKSSLLTANIDDSRIPTYIICNRPYLWVNDKWQAARDVLVYKDSKISVKIPFNEEAIRDNCFQWELR